MNRRKLLRLLGIGAIAAPAVTEALAASDENAIIADAADDSGGGSEIQQNYYYPCYLRGGCRYPKRCPQYGTCLGAPPDPQALK